MANSTLGKYGFEMCVSSAQGCKVAESLKADRVELCCALSEGGLTPSVGLIKSAVSVCKRTKVNVLIRPRAGDFIYDQEEIFAMVSDIEVCAEAGCSGVVFGCLDANGLLDVPAMDKLVAVAKKHNLKMTFHRAFDVCSDRKDILEKLIAYGFDLVLTSGGAASALGGIVELKALNEQANGRITLMAGAGVDPSNIAAIAVQTGITNFHFSAKSTVPSPMRYHNPAVFMGLPGSSEYELQITSKEKALATMQALRKPSDLQ